MSEFGGLRKHEKTRHALVGLGSAAPVDAAALPRKSDPNLSVKKKEKKRSLHTTATERQMHTGVHHNTNDNINDRKKHTLLTKCHLHVTLHFLSANIYVLGQQSCFIHSALLATLKVSPFPTSASQILPRCCCTERHAKIKATR